VLLGGLGTGWRAKEDEEDRVSGLCQAGEAEREGEGSGNRVESKQQRTDT